MRKLVVFAALTMCCSLANATITVDLETVTPEAPDVFTWSYKASLVNDARLDGGDDEYFTIYDFAGYIDGTVATTAIGWTARADTNLGRDVAGTAPGSGPYPADDPAIVNLIFEYVDGLYDTPGEIAGDFTAQSIFSQTDTRATFVSQSTNNTGSPTDGDPLGNIGTVPTPGPGDVIPEPASMVMMGSGLLGLVMVARRRK